MITAVEERIAREVLENTHDPALATMAIVLRRVFPKIIMMPIDLADIITTIAAHVDELDLEMEAEELEPR